MGELIDKLHSTLLNVGFASVDGDWNWKNVRSPFMRIYLITKGEAVVETKDESYRLFPNSLFLLPAFVNHNDICTGEFEHFYAHIYEFPNSWMHFSERMSSPMQIVAPDLALPLFRRLVQLFPTLKLGQADPSLYANHQPRLIQNLQFFKQKPTHVVLECQAIITILQNAFLEHVGAVSALTDNRLEGTLNYISTNIASNISIDDLARKACMSKSHFIRQFKREIGETPMRYINKKKIERAEQMLVLHEMPIKSIAYALGFDDCNYFFRVFKHFTGQTPQSYRAQIIQ